MKFREVDAELAQRIRIAGNASRGTESDDVARRSWQVWLYGRELRKRNRIYRYALL